MIILVFLLFAPIIVGSKKVTPTDLATVSTDIDQLTDQSYIDGPWIEYMVAAPGTINLLGQVMVVASKRDVSFAHYSPNHVYKYIKYPTSFRASLLQISNEGYRAFLGAHSSMNKIQLYMRQIPQHIKTIVKILSSKASPKLVSRMLPITINNIERIGKTCVTLARGTEDSFVSVMNILDEVIEITEATKGFYEKDLRQTEIELNLTHGVHADMKREEERRRQHYEEVRQSVRKAQEEYSRALSDIPTGWKALALELGRAVISTLKTAGQVFLASKMGGSSQMIQQTSGSGGIQSSGSGGFQSAVNSGAQSFGTGQILNVASKFAQSLDNLIEKLSSNENHTLDSEELQGYNVIFKSFGNLINNIPNNKLKTKAAGLIQRAMKLVDVAIKNTSAIITDKLETLANDIKPLMAAEEMSPTNSAPISTSTGGGESDSSNNEIYKAQIAQVRLAQTEKRLDDSFASHSAALEQMRQLSAKLASLDFARIDFKEILEMLKEAFKLLGTLRVHWHKLVLFFTDFSAQVVAGFDEKLKSFLDTSRAADFEQTEVDRIIMLELLNGNSISLYHESYLLFTMARVYFDVSRQYLMPRLASLSLMLTAANDDERKVLLNKLHSDTEDVQAKVTALLNERKANYKKVISEKRAGFNEQIDNQGEDGNEHDVIEEGKRLIGYDDTLKK